MDPEIKQMLDEAFAIDDAAKALCEQHERERAKRARVTKQHNPAGLVYKTYAADQQPAQQSQDTTEAWNTYVDGRINTKWNNELRGFVAKHIDNVLEALAEEIAEAFAIERKRSRDEMAAISKELTDVANRLGGLRADFEVDRGIRREVVVDLPKFVRKRDRDAA